MTRARPQDNGVIQAIALFGTLLLGLNAAQAHRLDEILQATRIAIGTNRVDIELDLTPGLETASRLLALIDLDRDDRISALEADAYADLVRTALSLKVDGRPTPLMVAVDAFPSPDEIKSGASLIRLNLSAALPAFRPGRHRLIFRNRHQPSSSVYLANALLPVSKRIEVTRQKRDPAQRGLLIEFTVTH